MQALRQGTVVGPIIGFEAQQAPENRGALGSAPVARATLDIDE